MSNEQQPMPITAGVQQLTSFLNTIIEEMPVANIAIDSVTVDERSIQINMTKVVVEKCHPTEGQEPEPASTPPPAPQNTSGAEAIPILYEASTSHGRHVVANPRRPSDARREGAVTRPRARKVQRMSGSGESSHTTSADSVPSAPARLTRPIIYNLKFGSILFGKPQQ